MYRKKYYLCTQKFIRTDIIHIIYIYTYYKTYKNIKNYGLRN